MGNCLSMPHIADNAANWLECLRYVPYYCVIVNPAASKEGVDHRAEPHGCPIYAGRGAGRRDSGVMRPEASATIRPLTCPSPSRFGGPLPLAAHAARGGKPLAPSPRVRGGRGAGWGARRRIRSTPALIVSGLACPASSKAEEALPEASRQPKSFGARRL